MYMVGGGSDRVHRGNKPYYGATRFMTPTKVKTPINWREVITNIIYGVIFFFALSILMLTLILSLG